MDTFSLIPNNTRLTATSVAGGRRAIHIAPVIVRATQPRADKREQMREIYADDPQSLIAAPNNYLKK